jgi:hypothetical protein
MPKPEPVTETEVAQVVKEALVKAFGKRQVPPGVIRRALAQVNFDLIQLELKEVGKGKG